MAWLAILSAQALDHLDAAGPAETQRLLVEAASFVAAGADADLAALVAEVRAALAAIH